MMGYIGTAIEVLFCIFVIYSVNKAVRDKDLVGVVRIADAFMWLGALIMVVLLTQAAADLNIVSSGIEVDGRDLLTMWAISYIIAWIMPYGFVSKANKTSASAGDE